MHLHDLPLVPFDTATTLSEYDRETCLGAAHAAAQIIKIWIRHIKADDNKIQEDLACGRAMGMSSRNRNGIAGPYVLVPWFWTADRLIKGVKVLKHLGRMDGERVEIAELTSRSSGVLGGCRDHRGGVEGSGGVVSYRVS